MTGFIEQHAALMRGLRERFLIAKGIRTLKSTACDLHMSPLTLRNWLTEDRATRVELLQKIETWCAEQEATRE